VAAVLCLFAERTDEHIFEAGLVEADDGELLVVDGALKVRDLLNSVWIH
jgi:hypothetical protein